MICRVLIFFLISLLLLNLVFIKVYFVPFGLLFSILVLENSVVEKSLQSCDLVALFIVHFHKLVQTHQFLNNGLLAY